MKKIILGVIALATLTFTSCSDDNDIPVTSNLTLEITSLKSLGTTYQYEGWIIVNGNPVSTGTFTVDDAGALSQTSFPVNTSQLAAASNFVLSIEPVPDTDPTPANTKILAGAFDGNSASINSDNIIVAPTSIIRTLGTSEGKYTLATPTDDDNTNELSGVWFFDNSTMAATTGLNLPTLSAGWKYEGWVVFPGGPVSTGTFTTANEADENAATSPFKGGLRNGPDFPGEDFVMGTAVGVNFPTTLVDRTIVISVEPDPDNSAAPFILKPLAHLVPMGTTSGSLQTMGAGPVAILSGTVTR